MSGRTLTRAAGGSSHPFLSIMEARVAISLQTNLKSRVPFAVGVYNGEVIVVCPGGRQVVEGLGASSVPETSCILTLYRLYNPNREVRGYGIL